jgi:hypothetical protein
MPVPIRVQHEALLKNLAFEGYISELIEYGKNTQPGLLERLGEERLRKILKTVCAKAETSFGFTERGSTHLYLDLVWTYGWDFESDPQYPWVMQTKEKNKALSQIEQAEILFEEMRDYGNAVNGDPFQHRLASIRNFQSLDMDTLTVREATFVPDLLLILHGIYPQKYERSGKEALERLVAQARAKAAEIFGFRELPHQGLVVVLAFLLGHEFHRNPFLDWLETGNYRQRGYGAHEIAREMKMFARNYFAEEEIQHVE